MQRMQGVLHETSFQTAQSRGSLSDASVTTTTTTTTAGLKRSWSDSNGHRDAQQTATDAPVRFQRASVLPTTASRLAPSSIVQLQHAPGDSEYSQRQKFAATPSSTHDAQLSLAHPLYALPQQLVDNFASLGIKHMYPWQKNCLKGPGLLSGERNLVYCAPTGGGKSLVADCEPVFLASVYHT